MGKGASNLANQTQQSQLQDSNALIQLAQGQAANANTLFQTSLPGFQQATSFYENLASGDPYAIARTLAPQAAAVDTASAGAKQNILQNGPAGGEKNLALEQVDVNRGAQIGGAATQGFLNAQNSLASLAQGGINSSQSATGLATSGLNSASSGFNNVGNQAIQQKGQTLGAFGALGGDATEVATKGMSGGGKSSGSGGGGGPDMTTINALSSMGLG